MGHHFEKHYSARSGWLRAAVLGANDGIVSTASLVIGVAAANADRPDILVAGVAGLVAGAMSMAAAEYVSVSSQAETQKADLQREARELEEHPDFEHQELAQIYVQRGLDSELAAKVAEQLMEHDALGAHARDELGLSSSHRARPFLAACTSGVSFTIGAALSLLALIMAPENQILLFVPLCSLLFLTFLGALASTLGCASILVGATRVAFWGALAMVITAAVGFLFGVVV